MKQHRGRRGVVGLAGAAVLAVALTGPAAAQADYLIRDVVLSKSEPFENPDACAPAAVAIPLPPSATRVRITEGPSRGDSLFAPSGEYEVGKVTGARIRPEGADEVLWGGAPNPGRCTPHYGEPVDYDDEGNDIYGPPESYSWKSQPQDFEVTYRRRQTVRLTRSSAAGLASEALARRFGQSYIQADDGYPRCRRPRHNHTTCRTAWFLGDAEWSGRVKVAARTTAHHRRLRWSYRLNVIQYDSYCGSALHKSFAQCSDRIRKRRHNIPVPGGKL